MRNKNRVGECLKEIFSKEKNHIWLFLSSLTLLTIFMTLCYQPSLNEVYGHDIHFHYRRLNALMDSLREGTFPTYIDYNAAQGFGYATKWFYPDFLLIPFALIGNITGTTFAYKLILLIMTFLCGLFSYLLIKKVFKSTFAASTGALLYTFSFYRLLDLYTRSALGEAISFTLIPIVFLGLYEIIKGNYKRWYIITMGFSLLIHTHILSSLLTMFFVIIFLLIYYKNMINEPKRIKYLIIAAIATIPLTAYFIFPLLEQMQSNTFYYQQMTDTLLPFKNKLSIKEIILGTTSGFIPKQYAFIPGTGLLLTLGIITRIFIRKNKTEEIKLADTGLVIGIICILLTLTFIPWARFPFTLFSVIQFPWRLFQFTSFFFAISSGYYLSVLIKKRKAKYVTLTITIVTTMFMILIEGYNYKTSPNMIYSITKDDLQNPLPTIKNHFNLGNLEYIPDRFPCYPKIRYPDTDYLHERSGIIKKQNVETTIENYNKTNGITRFDIKISKPDTLEMPLFFYKGYMVTLNNKEHSFQQSNEGLIKIPVTESGKMQIWYYGTLIQNISFYITIVSILLLCIYVFFFERKNKIK
ncbi:MAG: hypothetical protein ACK5MK_01125 [Dysgonomonas sp.]